MKVYNELSIYVDINRDVPFCNRGKLDTGTFCNYDCAFCYYRKDLDKVTPLETIKERVDQLVEYGITEADLSGGESSVHPSWFEILDYCREKNLRISTLSNGFKFADADFMKKSKEHGLEEILFSLHGSNEELHDNLVGRKGAFQKIIQAINNALMTDIRIRINCTVHNQNCENLDTEFVELMHDIRPLEVNFIPINYWESTDKSIEIDYEIVSNKIKAAIDKLEVPLINVRYIPFCYMKGYEKHVCDYYQNVYDRFDWNLVAYAGESTDLYLPDKYRFLYSQAAVNRLKYYIKPNECFNCKYFYLCDGIEKVLQETEIYPEPGEKIKDPIHYRKDFYANFGSEE